MSSRRAELPQSGRGREVPEMEMTNRATPPPVRGSATASPPHAYIGEDSEIDEEDDFDDEEEEELVHATASRAAGPVGAPAPRRRAPVHRVVLTAPTPGLLVPLPSRDRRKERGSQSLEWVALGGLVSAALAGGAVYASAHAAQIGDAIVNHLAGTLAR